MVGGSKSNPRSFTYAKVYSYALEVFQHDKDKTNTWWMSKIKEFGDKSPYEMVKTGKAKKIMTLLTRCRLG